MYRFALFVLLLCLKQSISQQPTFIKFVRNDIPINSLSEQTFLSVHNSNIKYIFVVKLQSCQIGVIDQDTFQQMPYLRVVSLPFNQIKEIPWMLLQKNRHIKIINFENNEIGMLQDGIFENLRLIESISFAHNKIVRVESNVFKDLTMLKNLDLSYNHLKNIWPDMFMSNMNLQKLQLDGNKIDRIEDMLFSRLENLLYLDLNRNQITELNMRAFENLKSMIMLNLEHNYITELDVGIFDNNTNLRALNLNENNLERIENGLFTKLMKLEHLSLKGNNIRFVGDDVFPQSPNLTTVSLCRNKLMSLKAKTFEKLYGLRSLCVADNPFYCDCNIMPFHMYYIKNENFTKETIICYQPENVALREWTEIKSTELNCDSVLGFEIEDIHLLPIANDRTKMPEYTLFPPFATNALDLPTESDFENENMTMDRIAREEMQIASMKVDLGGFQNQDSQYHQFYHAHNDDSSRLPDCFNNKPTYFDERYNKNFIEWRARFLGEFLIMYTSAKHKMFHTDNDVYKITAPAMLVPNINGYTFMDPSLSQEDWKYINDYLQEMCSITNNVLNRDSRNVVRNYAALEEVGKLIDSLGDVVNSKLQDNPNPSSKSNPSSNSNPSSYSNPSPHSNPSSNFNNGVKNNNMMANRKQPVREVHHMIMKTDETMSSLTEMMPDLEHLPTPNMTDGKNVFYYIIHAKAEGQGHVNINTKN